MIFCQALKQISEVTDFEPSSDRSRLNPYDIQGYYLTFIVYITVCNHF
ncbi:hypothetical protein [Dapis sp. BLCC M229]